MGLFSLLQMQGESSWSQNSLSMIKTSQNSQTSFRTLMTLIGLLCWTEAGESFIWILEYPSITKAIFLLLGCGSSTSCMTLMHLWAQKQDRFITLAPWDFMVDKRQL